MGLAYLDISAFRNLASVKLSPILSGFNIFYGQNGSGKTSLLEAIYYLSLARSFRTHQNDRIIAHSADKLSIFAQVYSGLEGEAASVGLERSYNGKLKLRINQQDVFSIAELAQLIPVQLMDSHSHHLLDAGPSVRRKYLDGGLFYFSSTFLSVWRQFERILKQRNAALRQGVPRTELGVWTEKLISIGETLHQLRLEYVTELIPILTNMAGKLLPFSELKISYYAGWDQRHSYAENLLKTIDRDYQLGYTQLGSHKADLQIIINDIPAKDILSRGQQKLFVCAMMLARGMLLNRQKKTVSVYLVDDLPSELDGTSRMNLTKLLLEQKAQVFITTTEQTIWQEEWEDLSASPFKMFHVEQGRINEMNTESIPLE